MRKLLPYLLSLALLLCGCGGGKSFTVQDFLLNTTVSITVYRRADLTAAQEALALCREYEGIFSRTAPGSELYRLNHREITEVSDPLAEVIGLGLHYAQLSGGAFDITAGSVVALWDFTAAEPIVPDAGEVARQLTHVGWEKVTLSGNTATFSDPGTMIDLGGIAKGYIADRAADSLRQAGVSSAVIDLGGNVACLGRKPDGSAYQVGVQAPFQERSEVIGALSAADQSVVTSGVYERYFTHNGALYHHILDTSTGYPADNGLLSVTIVSACSADCDALSTACFALGLEDGLALVESLEGVEALFITDDLQRHLSSGMEALFTPIT